MLFARPGRGAPPAGTEHAPIALSHRDRSILLAVAAGRGTVRCGCEPDLFVDALACCDQPAARRLVRAGLFVPVRPGRPGAMVPAALTELGGAVLRAYAP